MQPNEIWTLSFDAKASVAGTRITSYFYNNNSGIVQVSSGKSSTGATTSSPDGGITNILTTSYARY